MKAEEAAATNGVSHHEHCPKDIDYKKASLQKIGILFGILLTVVFVVYITPMPGEKN